ncbi:hypothetical protein [Planomonospora algeriensis]
MHGGESNSTAIIDLDGLSLASLQNAGAAVLRGFLERHVLDEREPSAGFQSSL